MNAAPASAAEVARLIGEAGPAGVSCRRQPGCGHWHLDLSRLNQLRFYTPGDLTVGAEAGMTVAALNAALAPEGQFVPLDVAAPGRATLGAVLAEHRSGPWRQRYGSVRDFTIGLEMATAAGELAHCGGRVVKNVAGYDWMKPVIGGRGALGIITAVNFKVFPLPRGVLTARCAPLDWDEVEALRLALLRSPLRPLAVELESHPERGRSVWVQCAGSPAVLARCRGELAAIAHCEFTESPLPQAPAAAGRLCLPPAQAVAALAALGPAAHAVGRLGLGVFEVAPAPAPPPVPAGAARLMRQLKAALDPDGRLHGDHCRG